MNKSRNEYIQSILFILTGLAILFYFAINNFDMQILSEGKGNINWILYWLLSIFLLELLVLLMSLKGIGESAQIKIVVTIVSILFIFYYFLNNPVNIQKVLDSGTPINWTFFWLGTLLAFLSNLLDGLAWHRILIYLDNRITKKDGVIDHLVGFSLGIFIPVAGTAELASKSVLLGKRYPGFTSEETVSSIAAIRTVFLITAYVAWGFLLVSLGVAHVISPLVTVVSLLVVWALLTVVIYFLISFFGNVDKFSSALAYLDSGAKRHHRVKGLFDALRGWLENFAKSFNQITKMSRKEIIVMMILVFSQNFIKWISVYLIYLAVLNLPFYIVMFISVAIGFVNLVPAGIPGLAGLREIATVEGLSIFVSNPDKLWISTLLQSASLYLFFLVAFIVGVPYWLLLKPVKEERQPRDGELNKNKLLENAEPA